MKNKILFIILLLTCAGLGAGWYLRHKQAVNESEASLAQIQWLSNEIKQTTAKLEEREFQVRQTRETNLLMTAELATFTEDISSLTKNLAKVEFEAKTAAETAQAELARRDAKIAELESQRDDLTKRMTDLNTAISSLEGTIDETERRLDAAEGDREFLLVELNRLQTEKAELERQFNDVAVLRQQLGHLRSELAIARRLDIMRRGLYGSTIVKGAELLQQGFAGTSEPAAGYDLQVELKQDGTRRVNPPGSDGQNAGHAGSQ